MIHITEQILRDTVTAFPFVERYGGIGVPIQTPDGIIPVSSYLSSDQCFQQNKYKNLVPDDRYASMAYFDASGSQTSAIEQSTRLKFNGVEITTTFKLVVWVNMPKLGLTNPEDISLIALQANNAIMKDFQGTFNGANVHMNITRTNILIDRASCFGAYAYADKQHLFMWPYGFFGIQATARTLMPLNCFSEIQYNPQSCITHW
jgi:hypothetical protein